jgi:two-component system, OmpR family, phosphate regulon sensor histidine kinase PhoR
MHIYFKYNMIKVKNMVKYSCVYINMYYERVGRMLKFIKKLFLINFKFMTEEYRNEFENIKTEINVERCKIAGKVLLGLNIVLLLIDIFLYRNMENETNAYTYLFFSHIIVFVLICLWFVLLRLYKKHNKFSRNKLLYYVFINIVICWCVFMGLNSINISGGISAYIICILGFSISMYLTPLETVIIFCASFIVFTIGLFLLVSDTNILYSHIINSVIVLICGGIASNLNYYSFIKEFTNKKVMLKSKTELEISNFKLKEYEKIRTDFFANISHELRTPINVIYSAEQIIDSKLKEKEHDVIKINKYLKMIKQNSYRLIRLINNLIDISKIDATIFEVKPINCDIVRIVEDITMSVVDYVENRSISLIFDTEIEEKIIACDPDKIERVMLNLLSNAIKFTKENGQIFVKIYIKDNNVYISVKDTGIGISQEMKELIFDRFIQVDKSISRNREGSGIGLSLVKSLVELHNGSIAINSSVGQGSEFIVSLPDIIIDSVHEENYFNSLNDQRVERINIEFSDIYE